MQQFLAFKENSDVGWIETDGDLLAEEMSSGSTNEYYLIKRNEQSGVVTLKPVTLTPSVSRTVNRKEIKADGEVLGGADI